MGRCIDRVLVVGHAGPVADLVSQLEREPYCGLKVVGLCVPDAEAERAERETGKVYAGFDGAGEAAVDAGADVVAVTAASEMVGPALRRLSWQLANHDISLAVAPGLMEVAGPRLHIRPVAGLPLLHVEHPRLDGVSRLCKGLFDRVLAGVALTLLLPVLVVIGMLVRVTSQGPAFFRQRRVGQGGQTFTCLKFRTMVADAERRLHEVAHLNRHPDGPLFKIMGDPRVTPLGLFLRRYSLDELPQLFHVLTGRMSLVGPRPPLPDEVAAYTDEVRRRLLVKPGLTGLWQISGRSNLSWDESVRLDLRYVENWSFALDLLILKKTIECCDEGDWCLLTGRARTAALAVALVLGSFLLVSPSAQAADPCNPLVNAIACENSKPGSPSSEWDVSGGGDSSIVGFATDISVNVGQTVHFKVDTDARAYTHRHLPARLLRRRRRPQDRQRQPVGEPAAEPAGLPHRHEHRPGRLRQLGRVGLLGGAERRRVRHLHRPPHADRHRR